MLSSSQLFYLTMTGMGSKKTQAETLWTLWRLCQRVPIIPVMNTDQQDTCCIPKGLYTRLVLLWQYQKIYIVQFLKCGFDYWLTDMKLCSLAVYFFFSKK